MILTLIVFILTLAVLVLSHEFGHFFIARKFGIKVLEFGFGIPPKVFAKKVGETVYSLNLLPVGGFVRLLGEDETDKELLNDKRSFAAQLVWKRIAVVVAGVIMNLVLAWLLFYIVIISQNFQIIYPTPNPGITIEEVDPNSPAETSGIKGSEQILEVNGQKISNIESVTKIIKENPGKEIKIKVSQLETATPQVLSVTPNKDGRIGVVLTEVPVRVYKTTSEKVFSGISYSWDLIKFTLVGLGQLVGNLTSESPSQALQNATGPIGIAVVSHNILSSGKDALLPYLWFMGVLSLTLAVMNILPIPALDGGRLLFLIIELIFRRKANAVVERWVNLIGMAGLLTLISYITFLDFQRFILPKLTTLIK